MEEGTSRKRQREEAGPAVALKLKNSTAAPASEKDNSDLDQEREVTMAWLTDLEEGAAFTELFDLLDSSSGPAAATSSLPGHPVKFIDDPYSSLVIFQSSSAYVTINGNEESCGSSFSDLDSSVMASVDMSGVRGLVRRLSDKLNVDGGGAEEGDEGAARGWLEEKDLVGGIFVKSLSGCDLLSSPLPLSYNCEDNAVGGGGSGSGGEDEMWMNFVAEDVFDGAW